MEDRGRTHFPRNSKLLVDRLGFEEPVDIFLNGLLELWFQDNIIPIPFLYVKLWEEPLSFGNVLSEPGLTQSE